MTDIETRHFETARDFLLALSRSDPYWLADGEWQTHWLFRGQCNADWGLSPSAFREVCFLDPLYKFLDGCDWKNEVQHAAIQGEHTKGLNDATYWERVRRLVVQTHFEFRAARAFADLVDDLGLPIPGGPLPDRIRYDLLRWFDDTPPFHPTVALAQHHGMHTRLLDWTHNPLIAAFFAADGAQVAEEGNIAVWAVDRRLLAMSSYREFTVQRSQFGYLRAQEGLFTYSTRADYEFMKHGIWPRIEQDIPQALRKLTLPKRLARELERLLWIERISKAHLMPSLDNVTKV